MGKLNQAALRKLMISTLFLSIGSAAISQTIIWSDDFEAPVPDWTLNILTGQNDANANIWEINDTEGGVAPPGCGVAANGDATLHVTCTGGLCLGTGALYNAGDNGGGFSPATTNTRAAYNLPISTLGQTNLTLNFDWIGVGETGFDFASLEYSTDGGGTWNNLNDFSAGATCGGGQGQWANYSLNLPVACENQADLRFAFHWTNDNNGSGTDPSFAVNDMELTVPTLAGPTASFTANNTTICENDCVTFTDQSVGTNLNNWDWVFDTGGSGNATCVGCAGPTATFNGQNPPQVCYSTAGTYTVMLTVTDANGTDDTTIVNYITVNTCGQPVASFTANNTTICENDCVTFTDQSTGSNLNNWDWVFDTGGSGNATCVGCTGPTATFNGQNPPQVCYSTAGTYTVMLTVTDDNGTDDTTIVNYITVNNCGQPVASFTANNTTICENDCVTFTDQSTGSNINNWDWVFDTGGSGNATCTGCTGPTATFNGQNPPQVCYSTAGTYTVMLTITDDNGTDDTTIVNYITVNNCGQPVASFTANNTTICENDCVTFTDQSTGSNINNWDWVFDTGGSGSATCTGCTGPTATFNGQNPPQVCYSTAGTYTVMLTITDDNGTDDTTIVNYITVNSCTTGPTASFSVDNGTICENGCVNFTDLSVGTNINNWAWSFPGGTPASFNGQTPPTICYPNIGTYDVLLTVSDANGIDDTTVTAMINVIDCTPPTGSWFASDTLLCPGDCIDFTSSYINATSYQWTFTGGNPSSDTVANPTNICFDSEGTYNVQLIVNGPGGADTSTQTIVVQPQPAVDAGFIQFVTSGVPFTVEAFGTGSGSYSWTPSDNLDCPDCQSTTGVLDSTTVLWVTFTDTNGCMASDSVIIDVEYIANVGVPNAFSPNGDGVNDVLYVKGAGIASMNFIIYNRYGQQVFQSQKQSDGWDGTHKGKQLNPGVFVYYLDVKFRTINGDRAPNKTLKGNITLIK